MFTSGLEDQGSICGQVIPKTQKMELDASLLYTQHYMVEIKGKWSNPGKGLAFFPTSCYGMVAIEKQPSGHQLTYEYVKMSNL